MRYIGDLLEHFTSKKFGFKHTANTGAVRQDGDLYGTLFRGEAKATKKKSVSIKLNIWKKIKGEASDYGQMPLLIHGFISDNDNVDEMLITTTPEILDYIINPNKLLLEKIANSIEDKLYDYDLQDSIISNIINDILKIKIDI